MAESIPGPPGASDGEPPETLLRRGGREADLALQALEGAALRDRRFIAALEEELARSAPDLQYERKWRGKDPLLSLVRFLLEQAKAADGALGDLLKQVADCRALRDRPPERVEAMAVLEAELAPYARAVADPDAPADSGTPYGAFLPLTRRARAALEEAGRELSLRPAPEDFVEGSMRKRYAAALERLGGLLAGREPPPYADLHGQVARARETLMRGVAGVRERTDKDAEVLRNIRQVATDLAPDFERIEMMFAELEAAKSGEPQRSRTPDAPSATGADAGPARKRGLLGRLRRAS